MCIRDSICTAEGEILTLIGNRLGWPREHCSVKPIDFFGLQCDAPPPLGTGCLDNSIVGLCDGAFFFCRLDASQNFTFEDDELYRSFLKAIAIKQRARRFKEQANVKLIQEIIQELWGGEAWVVSANNGVISVSAGRDLSFDEVCLLSLYEQVICVGPGIRLEIFCIAPDQVNCDTPVAPNNSPFMDVCEDGEIINITHGAFNTPIGAIPTLSAAGLPPNITFTDNGDGSFTLSGTCDATGTSAYSITAMNGGESITVMGNTFTQNVANVNNPPVANGVVPNSQTITDGDTIIPMDFSSCFTDPDGDLLQFSLTPAIAGLSIDPLTGVVTGSPSGIAAPFPMTISVIVTATDPDGESDTCQADIIINELITGPTAPSLSGLDCPVFPTVLENQPSATVLGPFSPFNGSGTITVSGIPTSFLTQVGNSYELVIPANTPASGIEIYSVTLTNASGSVTCSGNSLEIVGL